MMDWLKAQAKLYSGIALAIIVIVLLIFGTIKFLGWNDARKAKQHAEKIIGAQAQGDSAASAENMADTAHAQGVVAKENYHALITSRRITSNPAAMEVVTAGKKVSDKTDTEVVDLRDENKHLKRQVNELQAAGTAPGPRAIPYIDPLYSFSNKRRAVVTARVGVDYRLTQYVGVKVELGYMPPIPNSSSQAPEFVVNVGGHITFR